MSETSRAYDRRSRSRFFERYIFGRGIDIGCGPNERLTPDCDGFDKRRNIPDILYGDATYMEGVPDETYDYVYSSHCLEHLQDISLALANWYRILKTGGYLIITVPHRDYYEKKRELPSVANKSHKHFFLPFVVELPDTLSLHNEVTSTLPSLHIVYLNECYEGDYSIEMVGQKGCYTPMFLNNANAK